MNGKLEEEVVEVAHKEWWQNFEVVFGIAFLAAIALEFMMPLSFPEGLPTSVFIPAGIFLIIAGGILVILARRKFVQHDQPTDPGHPTSKLITTGVFSISRNPLYLGGICILVGIALVLNLVWALVLMPMAIIASHYILIAPEEQYLEAKFGAAYQAYVDSVNRWLGWAGNRKSN